MNTPPHSPTSRFSIPALMWSTCCLISGITFLVLAGLDYTKCAQTQKSLNNLQSEISQTVQEHDSALTLLTELTEKETENAIARDQHIKLEGENRKIKESLYVQISSFRNLKKDLTEGSHKLQQAMSEIRFAKAKLEASGMSRENIENLLRELCEQTEKKLR